MTVNTLTITDVKTASIEAPWGPWTRRWLLVRIETAEGVHGYGDTWASPQTNAAVMELKETLIGKDPTNVEALHRGMVPTAYAVFAGSHVNSGSAVHAVSAIETALWDLAGKAAGVPVYKLLGGKHRDKVRLYCCVGDLDSYLEMEGVYDEMGVSILKFDVTPNAVKDIPGALMDKHLTRKGLARIVGLMDEIRSRVPADAEVSVEGRCGTLANAMRFVKAMEPYDLAWAEDLLPPTDVDAWAALTASTPGADADGRGAAPPAGVPGVLPAERDARLGAGLSDLRRAVRGQEDRRDGGHAADAGVPAQRVEPHRHSGGAARVRCDPEPAGPGVPRDAGLGPDTGRLPTVDLRRVHRRARRPGPGRRA